MTTETPTLNNAQRDGIHDLLEAAQGLAERIELERRDLDRRGGTPLSRVDIMLQCRFPVGPVERAILDSIIAWVDTELFILTDDNPAEKEIRAALYRLLDDATALLRWVDGAL